MKATFAGANIKGTPSMKAPAVKHDLNVLRRIADVFVVQEFKWTWYWTTMVGVLVGWSSYPSHFLGTVRPIEAANAIFWKRKLFKKLKTFSRPAFDFDLDNAGIMDNRWIKAVLLQSKLDKFTAWYLTTHFVVGGDEITDSPRRRRFMGQNIERLDEVLEILQNSGYPICGELDANIHKDTWAYQNLMSVLRAHGAKVHGQHGVEYAFTINGRHGTWTDVKPSVIPTSQLKTDHEIRVLDWTGKERP